MGESQVPRWLLEENFPEASHNQGHPHPPIEWVSEQVSGETKLSHDKPLTDGSLFELSYLKKNPECL
jgi:hypothetical protein